ncbi:MAG: ribonucleoside triphosphate reductase [Patescibacteria group bacterium]|nr:ribonucleoside triphosphate reductase [Patescibacteria group bacterium]
MSKKKISKILKRDGKISDFNEKKIQEAILKALNITGEAIKSEKKAKILSEKVIEILAKKFHSRSIPAVEEVQDIVEEALITSRLIKTAKAYILYRDQRAKLREVESLIDSSELMKKYLDKLDWRIKENSNMSYSLQGLNNHIASAVSSRYWLNKVYSKKIGDTHTEGDIHIHDLQLLAPYCAGWDLKDLLVRGFGGVSGKVESKPAKHFRTALGQIINFFYTLQGEVAGAEAFSNFDTYLAPFIKYDKLNYDEVKQALQEFLFNINVPTRVGFQTPFTNLTMDLFAPNMMKNESVIIGGKPQKEKYGDFQKEMDTLNMAFAELMMEGDAKGRVFTFPIPTYNITKNFDWDSKVMLKVFEMTAKYGIPYFSNFINSDMSPEDARSMCCRLRLDNRELRKRGGGLFGANPLTGSIGVVTINLPRIGYLSNKKFPKDIEKAKKYFFERLAGFMDVAKDSLEVKRELIEKLSDNGLYPYARHYLDGIKKKFNQYWKNHFATIGINGMNEACLNLFGENVGSEQGKKFALEIMDFMRGKMTKYQNETNNLYNLEATPAEGVTRRFANLDKKKYSDIIVANEKEVKEKGVAPYYTNSSHLPVNFSEDIFEVLDLQDELQTKYTGGTVIHGFIGEKMPSVEATKKIVRKIAENYRLPYYTISPTFSICPEHGYIAGEHFKCPKCKAETEVYSRVVGYLRPVKQWNDSKQAEYNKRVEYKIKN